MKAADQQISEKILTSIANYFFQLFRNNPLNQYVEKPKATSVSIKYCFIRVDFFVYPTWFLSVKEIVQWIICLYRHKLNCCQQAPRTYQCCVTKMTFAAFF
jgi:hypothetical protein